MRFNKLVVGVVMAAAAAASNAATFNFSGTISTQKDIIVVPFSLTQDATDVRVWTDSYKDGQNFDPITAVWRADGTRIGQNDDNNGIAPGQTRYDSGLVFSTLAKGDYLFTIAAFNNFANGTQLSQGFNFDNQAPVALANWDQPASHRGMGANFSVHLSGVDSATSPVPEPGTYAMLLGGLGLLGFMARRRQG